MILNAIIDDQIYTLNVPDEMLAEAGDFFDRMDSDMDHGVQMSREWVENPSQEQRCQVAADKLLTALENENHKLGRLMAGYILVRQPNIDSVQIDTSGDMTATMFNYKSGAAPVSASSPGTGVTVDNPEAFSQAEKDVSQVFKGGKQWKFSIFDLSTNTWTDSPAFADQDAAEMARKAAIMQRYKLLCSQ